MLNASVFPPASGSHASVFSFASGSSSPMYSPRPSPKSAVICSATPIGYLSFTSFPDARGDSLVHPSFVGARISSSATPSVKGSTPFTTGNTTVSNPSSSPGVRTVIRERAWDSPAASLVSTLTAIPSDHVSETTPSFPSALHSTSHGRPAFSYDVSFFSSPSLTRTRHSAAEAASTSSSSFSATLS